MSLPTYAQFYDESNEIIAKHFVNVGWWLTADNFIDTVVNLPWVRDAKYISLYGIRIECWVLEKPDDTPWPPWRDGLVAMLTPVIKQWERDNQDLREVLKRLYNATN